MKRLFSVLTLIIVLSVPAFALSDSEFLKLKKDSDFRKADKELNQAYKEAQASMTKTESEKLKREQRQWITSGRDREAQKLLKEGYDSTTEAYTEATRRRAREIYGRIPHDLSSITPDDFIGDYYDNNNLHLSIWRDNSKKRKLCVSLYEPRRNSPDMFGYPNGNVLEAEFDYDDDDLMNILKYEAGIEEEGNLNLRATLTMLNRNTIKLEASSDLDNLFDLTGGNFIRKHD